jgi:hypothetical protein
MLKGCYFGLRNLNYIAIGRKVQMLSQEYVIHGVSSCGRVKQNSFLKLATEVQQ